MESKTQVMKGEEVSRSTTVDSAKGVVTKVHVTQHGSGDNVTLHKLTWKFDFTGVNQEQLLELASRDLVIKQRPKFKECPDKEVDSWDGMTINVADMLVRERKGMSPAEKAKKALGQLSPEAREQLLKELMEG